MSFLTVKDQAKIEDVARDHGVELDNNKARCIFHQEDNPSLVIYPGSNSFYCFGCGSGGSVIDFHMQVKGTDALSAARELAKRYGIPWEDKETPEARQQREQEEKRQAKMEQAVAFWSKQLRPQDREHLQARGLTPELIEKLRIGYEPREVPEDVEAARRMGLVTEGGYLPAHSIIFPFRHYGKVALPVFYRPEQKPRYLYPKGCHKPLIGADTISRSQELYLVEGIFDYLSLLQAGFPALCAFGTRLSELQKQSLARAKRIFIAYDADPAGREAALEICRDFYPAARMLALPEGKDVNDLLVEEPEHFPARIEELRQASRDVLDVELEDLAHLQTWEREEAVRSRVIPLVARLDRGSQENFFDQNKKTLGLKTSRAFKAALKGYQQGSVDQQQQEQGSCELSAEEAAAANTLLQSPEILNLFKVATERIGHVGEDINKQYLYLAMTSRLLDKPVSTVVKGESSAGKSYLVDTVAQFFPREEIYQFTRVTANVLYYSEKSFSHKMLIIMERAGSEDSDYTIRSFISEGKLRISCTVKDPETGELKEMDKEVEGPIGYIETTTQAAIHNENQTRVFDIFIDEGEAQTCQILEAERRRAVGGTITNNEKERILQPFIHAQSLLKPFKVIIPYAGKIQFPTKKVRVRRDFKRFLALIEASALLHQQQRQTKERDGETYLIAELADYAIAYEIAQVVLSQTLKDISPGAERMAKVAQDLFAKMAQNKKPKVLTRKDFYRYLPEMGRSTIDRYLEELVMVGVLEQEGGGKGRGKKILSLPYMDPEDVKVLIPSPEEIAEAMQQDTQDP